MSAGDDEPAEAAHVFDQTNGVLGTETEPEEPRRGSKQPPSSFGVPPIVSL